MLKKLRNKFFIINMAIISIMMIASFSVIYFITYNNFQTVNKNKIDSVEFREKSTKKATSTPAFLIVVNENGEIEYNDSIFDMPDKTYQKAVELAWKEKMNYSLIKVDNVEWMYVLRHDEKASSLVDIIFLDVTDSNRTLSSLLTVLLFIGFFMLFIIAAISFYFANRSVRPIEEAWEKQEQFITDASHELKTPLAIVKSNLKELNELWNNREEAESQVEWFGYIDIGIERMSKLINELLTLLEIENINLIIKSKQFDMSKIIEDAIQPIKAGAAQKGVHLTTSIEPHIMINGDSERITQVITILLDNAIKYTNDNGWIEVLLKKSKRHVTCSIKNSGEGIPQKDLPKIFDRFYRADSSRNSKSGSFGLGLSIAKTIMEKLGGKISAICEDDGTTVFIFTLMQ